MLQAQNQNGKSIRFLRTSNNNYAKPSNMFSKKYVIQCEEHASIIERQMRIFK